ncbi:MAG: hypothetical protein ACI9GZ_002354, partial [Bacteroidia bacterium]
SKMMTQNSDGSVSVQFSRRGESFSYEYANSDEGLILKK